MQVEWRLVEILEGKRADDRYGHAEFTSDEDGSIFVLGGKTRDYFDISRVSLHNDSSGHPVCAEVNEVHYGAKERSRWAFAYAHCKEEKLFFMHGGFDSQYNHATTRFFTPGHGNIRCPCNERDAPSPRGYHSAVYLQTKDNPALDANCVYTFGGQCCVGGPYEFYNDLHRLNLRTMDWERVAFARDTIPPLARSQSLLFTWRGHIYVYGGYNSRSIFTDLYRFDPISLRWSAVATTGEAPVGLTGIAQQPFRVSSARTGGVVIGKRLVLVAERFDRGVLGVHVLDLVRWRWQRCSGITLPKTGSGVQAMPKSIPLDPPARGNFTLSRRQGSLFVFGGHDKHDHVAKDSSHMWMLRLPRKMDWACERLLWLACFKNNRDECNLAKCPPHVIYHIIGYVNSNTFNLE